jgi:hypothetical protein
MENAVSCIAAGALWWPARRGAAAAPLAKRSTQAGEINGAAGDVRAHAGEKTFRSAMIHGRPAHRLRSCGEIERDRGGGEGK